ncbi:hypothetical protein [Nocardioides jensenii]|uniref:hypothetical protein n=1 Tax=Nocardioides jensenii TaxID=1843 RepID=UPI00082CAFD3|nr:hypothetical protein [Nocardioides jensenii]
MTFELLPNLTALIAVYAVVLTAAAIGLVTVVTSFVVANRSERLARGESMKSYYGGLHFAH